MTNEQLDELQRLHEAATPGPWEPTTQWEYRSFSADDFFAVAPNGEGAGTYDPPGVQRGSDETRANAELIAAARNALPELLAAARENAAPEIIADVGMPERCGAAWGNQTCELIVAHAGIHIGDLHRSGWTDENPGTAPHRHAAKWASQVQYLSAIARRFEEQRNAALARVKELEAALQAIMEGLNAPIVMDGARDSVGNTLHAERKRIKRIVRAHAPRLTPEENKP